MTSLDITRNLVRSQTMSGDYSNAIRSRRSGVAEDTNYSLRQSAPIGSLPETSPPAFKAWNIPNSGARRDYSADPQFMEFPHLTRAAHAIASAAHEYGNTFVRNRLASERIRQADARQEQRRARSAELEEQRASTSEERELLAQGRRTRQLEAHERLNRREARLSERENRLQEREARIQAREAARGTGTAAKDDADSGPSIPPQGGLGNVTGAGMVTSLQPAGQVSPAAPPKTLKELQSDALDMRSDLVSRIQPMILTGVPGYDPSNPRVARESLLLSRTVDLAGGATWVPIEPDPGRDSDGNKLLRKYQYTPYSHEQAVLSGRGPTAEDFSRILADLPPVKYRGKPENKARNAKAKYIVATRGTAAPQTTTSPSSSDFDDETARIREETLKKFYPESSVRSSTDKRRGNVPRGEV